MRISDWSSDVCSSDLADLRSDRSGKVPHQPVFVDRRQLSMVHRIPLHLFRDCAPDSPNSGRRHSCRSSGYFLHIRSEEHTSELQSLMRISYAVFCLKKKIQEDNDKQLNVHL